MSDKKTVQPFCGIHYNLDKVTSMQDVVTPPYDVINPDLQNQFYERSPYNFCRIDLTKEQGPERYEKASSTFEEWLQENVLISDEQPAIYLHFHHFTLPDGQKITRKGFLAARRLEDFSEGGIKPHEKTLDGPKQDRLSLTRSLNSQLSPVFSLYSDPEQKLSQLFEETSETTPYFDFVTHEGERHQVWKIQNESVCEEVNQFFNNTPLFIADGHHRYETALNFFKESLQANPNLPENAASRFIMMYFSNLNDTGLVILPIHRALHNLGTLSLADLLSKLSQKFDVEKVEWSDQGTMMQKLAENPENDHRFYLISKNTEDSYQVSISKEKWLATECAQSLPEELRDLDVTVLHQYIFQNLLDISEEAQANQENIIYWKSTEKAIEETRQGSCDMTFLLNPTRIEDVQKIANSGLKMPQKSTYFYPKVISGLVVHPVNHDSAVGTK